MRKKSDDTLPIPSNTSSLFDEDTLNELLGEGLGAGSTESAPKTETERVKPPHAKKSDLVAADPTLDEWKRLYEVASQFRDVGPWNWMFEDQLFAVVNPEDGEVGYCSVMGAGGEFHALCVYRGEEGLLSYERISRFSDEPTADDMSGLADPDVVLNQKSLMLSFEGSTDVDKQDRKVFQALGLKYRGKQAWPIARSYEPGFVPWFLNAAECRFLTQAIEQVMVVTVRIKETPELLDAQPGCILTRTTNGAEVAATEWVDAWPAWPYLEDELENAFVYPPVKIDEMRLKRALRAGKPSGAWEVDISYAPFSVREGARPYFPRLMLCVHHQSGTILSAHPAELSAEASEFVDQFVRAMEHSKMVPEQIVVRRQSVAQLLLPVAHALGADLLGADFLPGIEMAREEMQEFMR